MWACFARSSAFVSLKAIAQARSLWPTHGRVAPRVAIGRAIVTGVAPQCIAANPYWHRLAAAMLSVPEQHKSDRPRAPYRRRRPWCLCWHGHVLRATHLTAKVDPPLHRGIDVDQSKRCRSAMLIDHADHAASQVITQSQARGQPLPDHFDAKPHDRCFEFGHLRYIASELVVPLAGVIATARQSRHARVPDLIVDPGESQRAGKGKLNPAKREAGRDACLTRCGSLVHSDRDLIPRAVLRSPLFR